ncbi:MAG TPA: hypothetical protein VFE78_10615 [Gemmataceae bacterium]|nr:hypothetical protein [Gemmataceae bacterium]
MTWRRALLVVSLAALIAVPLSGAATVWLNRPSHRVVVELPQPAGLDYKSFGPYSVYVLEGARDWSSPLALPMRYSVVVARSGMAPPDYGHALAYSFHPGFDEDAEAHMRNSTAEWVPEGVTFVETSGHRLFIPVKMFVGGR